MITLPLNSQETLMHTSLLYHLLCAYLNNHLVSSEGKEFIIHISLHLRALIHGGTQLIPEVRQDTDEFVEVRVCIVMRPQRFSIALEIALTRKCLFCSVVDDGDTLQG